MNEHILTGLVALVALGAGAQWLAWRLRIPSILVLLVVGFIAGPVSGLLNPDALLGRVLFPLVSLGAAVVLFEGGLTASWSDIRTVAAPVRRLITVGLLVTWIGATVAAYYLLDLHFGLAALLGAILVVTGPTVIGPILRYARPRGQVGPILKFEGTINDPLGAILAVLVFQVIEAEQIDTAVSLVAFGVLKAAVLASGIGLGAAWLYVIVRRRKWLPGRLANSVLLPLALCAYALAGLVQHESGLLAITVMGIALASQTKVNIDVSVEFTEQARNMLISLLFVLLAARMQWSDLTSLPLGAVGFVAVIILVLRPVAVALATLGTSLSFRERLFLSAVAPRGIVAAAVSSVFALRLVDAGYEQASLLMPITFLVIAVGVAVYGLGSRALVRVLGLSQTRAFGLLILGANHIARLLAGCLKQQGVRVLLVDSDRPKVMKARQLGLEAEHGRLLSDHVLDQLDLDGIGRFLALTPREDTNTLGATHFRDVFGRGRVHQIHTSTEGTPHLPYASELRGTHFADGMSYDELSALVLGGASAKVTKLTSSFSFEDFAGQHGNRAVPLFVLSGDESLRVFDTGTEPPMAGERVISLVPAD